MSPKRGGPSGESRWAGQSNCTRLCHESSNGSFFRAVEWTKGDP